MNDSKIGRNDICFCGSGKKYKKCCYLKVATSNSLRMQPTNEQYGKIRKTEGEIVDKFLMPYVIKTFGKEVLEESWSDFIDADLEIPEDQMNLFYENMFIPWFLFNWVPYDLEFAERHKIDQPIAGMFLATKIANNLSEFQQKFILEMLQTYYSFYVVSEVIIDEAIVMKDLLLGSQHRVSEQRGTHYLEPGNIIFSRILNFNEQSICVGMAPLIVPARYYNEILDLRDDLISENSRELDIECLRDDYELEMRLYFFDLIESAMNPAMPVLHNLDGDLMEECVIEFNLLIPIEHAVEKLLGLTLGLDKNKILQEAKRNSNGNIVQVELPFLKQAENKEENILLGHIIIQEKKLTVNVNSRERGQKAIAVISKLLGESADYVSTTTTSMGEIWEKVKESKDVISSSSVRPELAADPQLSEAMNAIVERHWKKWFDEIVPALNNQTPRQAVKTKAGRERLEGLFLLYEEMSGRSDDNIFKPDVDYLRKELGM